MRVIEWTEVRGTWMEGRPGEESVRLAALRHSMYLYIRLNKEINICDKKLHKNLKNSFAELY
jgi:hypothetical protein